MATTRSRILSLDLGTTTGWALTTDGLASVKSGTVKFSTKKFDNKSFLQFFYWLEDFMEKNKVTVLVVEKPTVSKFFNALRILYGMFAIAQMVSVGFKAEWFEFSTSTVKKFWTGNGGADKDKMLEATRVLGFKPKDHNEADAIAGLHWFCMKGTK